MPHEGSISKSPKPEKNQSSSECLESDLDVDIDKVPDYLARSQNDYRKPKPFRRHTQILRKAPQGWPKSRNESECPTPNSSSEYIPMISSPHPKPSDARKLLWNEVGIRHQGWPKGPGVPPRPSKYYDDMVYTNPMDKHLYHEPGGKIPEMKTNS